MVGEHRPNENSCCRGYNQPCCSKLFVNQIKDIHGNYLWMEMNLDIFKAAAHFLRGKGCIASGNFCYWNEHACHFYTPWHYAFSFFWRCLFLDLFMLFLNFRLRGSLSGACCAEREVNNANTHNRIGCSSFRTCSGIARLLIATTMPVLLVAPPAASASVPAPEFAPAAIAAATLGVAAALTLMAAAWLSSFSRCLRSQTHRERKLHYYCSD